MASPKVERKRPPMPESVGRYEVLLPIGSGGTATIYLARASGAGGFEREVALKLTHPHLHDNAEFANDVIEEAKLAVRIRHPNVVSILDAGDDPYGVFLVMDYIEGDTLGGLMRRPVTSGALMPFGVGLRVLVDALTGLHAAHELVGDDGSNLGLVHRDFSPQNILVGLDGVSRLADFGIAKAESRLGHTRTGNIKGKFGFMSPEQARMAPLDRRSDVWAAGVIAWELFTRQRLYPTSGDDLAVLLRIATEDPPRIRSVRSDVHRAIDDAVDHALERDVEARTPSAEAFAKELLGACKSAGIEPATHAEVGSLVAKVAGSKLDARRAQAKEVVEVRARVDDLVEAARDHTPSASPALSLPKVSDEVASRETLAGEMESPPPRVQPARTSSAGQRTSQRLSSFAAIGALALAGIAILVIAATSNKTPSIEPSVPSVVAPPPPALTTTDPVFPSAVEPRSPRRVTVSSNASIATLRVADRAIAIAQPAKEITVELTPDEANQPARIEATTNDGRRLTATVEVDMATATLRFPPPRPAVVLPASPYGKRHP